MVSGTIILKCINASHFKADTLETQLFWEEDALAGFNKQRKNTVDDKALYSQTITEKSLT